MAKIPVFIIDDQNLFRQSLAILINSIDELELAGDFNSGASFLDHLNRIPILETYIALVDLDMPGINGMEVVKILHEKCPQVKSIVLSVHINPTLISQMINEGACAYLAKNCDKNELTLAIDMVYKTGFYFNLAVHKALKKNTRSKKPVQDLSSLPVNLTKREIEILQLICYEYNNAEIGEKLYLSPRTVEWHKNSLLTKTGVRTTPGLVLFALKHGIFSAPI